MAARRVSKSVVDWAAIAERVPERQKDAYRVFRQATEKHTNRITELPESLPKINFEEYRNRITNKAMVAEFEKLYSAMQVAYPKDISGALKKIQTEEKAALERKASVVASKKVDIQHFQQLKDVMKLVPPPEQMTTQMYNYYFPEYARNPNKEDPGHYPVFRQEIQLANAHLTGHMHYNNDNDRRFVQTVKEHDEDAAAEMKLQQEEEVKRKEQEQVEAPKK